MKKALTGKWLIVLLSITAAGAGEKEKPKFTPGPVTDYPNRQAIEQVTIAVAPFFREVDTAKAFGKLNPNKYGVLPVLVIVQNDSGKTLALDRLNVEFMTPDHDHIEATPAADIRYLSGPGRPNLYPGPIPGRAPHISKTKNPLNAWEIEGRAFTARMLPPKESASGFFYFRAPYRSGSTVFLRGIREASSGKELFYFEIPLDQTQTSERPLRRPVRETHPVRQAPLGIPGPWPRPLPTSAGQPS